MLYRIDEARRNALFVLAKRIGFAVGVIALGAVVDLIPERFAELSLGIGVCVLLAAAVLPLPLLGRMTGASSAGATRTGDA